MGAIGKKINEAVSAKDLQYPACSKNTRTPHFLLDL